MTKRFSLLFLIGMLVALPVCSQEGSQWTLMMTKTFVEGGSTDGTHSGIESAKEGHAAFTIQHYRPDFQGVKGYNNIHHLSVSYSNPQSRINVGDENQIFIEYEAEYDNKPYSHDRLASDAFGGTMGGDGYGIDVEIQVIPALKSGSTTIGYSLMEKALRESNSSEELAKKIGNAYNGVNEEDLNRWVQAIGNDDNIKLSASGYNKPSGRITFDKNWTPPVIDNDAYMTIKVTVECRVRPYGAMKSSTWKTSQIYLYKINLAEGHWKQVKRRLLGPDYKNYKYKGDITTETVVTHGPTWAQYRMDCTENQVESSVYHKGNCQGEFLEAGVSFVDPLKYYAPGNLIQTTFCTKTTHSDKVCPHGLAFPVIQAYLTTPSDNKIIAYLENAEGKHLFEALHKHVKTEEATNWGMNVVHVMNVADINEKADAAMPGHEVGDTVLVNYFISNGQRKHDRMVVYTYVWDNSDKPVNTATYEDKKEKTKWYVPGNDDDDSSSDWVLIPIVIGGVLGGGGVVGWILLRSKPKSLLNPDKKDKRYYEVTYNITDDKAIRQMQKKEQMIHQIDANTEIELGDNFHNRVVTAVILDKSGDVAVEVLDNLGEKLISRVLKHGKTYLKGLAEDGVAGKEVKISLLKSTVKVVNDEAKDFIPDAIGVKGFGQKVYLKTMSDTMSNSFLSFVENNGQIDRNKVLSDTVLNGIGNFLDEFKFEDLTEIEGNKEIMKGLGEYLKRVFSYGTDSDVQDAISGARK